MSFWHVLVFQGTLDESAIVTPRSQRWWRTEPVYGCSKDHRGSWCNASSTRLSSHYGYINTEVHAGIDQHCCMSNIPDVGSVSMIRSERGDWRYYTDAGTRYVYRRAKVLHIQNVAVQQ